MPRILASNIMDREQLEAQIMGLRSILPKELIDYLFALLDLEVSALSRKDITSEEFVALSDLVTFRELVFYNLYKIAQSYINPKNGRYQEEDYTDGFNISYGDIKTKDTLFNISKTAIGTKESSIRLYNLEEPTFEDVVLSYDRKVASLEEYVDGFHKRFPGGNTSSNSEFVLEQLKKLTLDDLKTKHNLLLDIVRRQIAFYKAILEDSNLIPNLEQSQKQDDIQEVKEGCVKVLVRTQSKTPIFY